MRRRKVAGALFSAAVASSLELGCGRIGYEDLRSADVVIVDAQQTGDAVPDDGSATSVLWLEKTTQADFEAAGSTRTALDTTTVPGELRMTTAPAAALTSGPTLSGAAGSGAHSLSLGQDRYLIVLGNSTSTTALYDARAGTITPGPSIPGASAAQMRVSGGAHAVRLSSGMFLVIHGDDAGFTSLVDPTTGSVSVGPSVGTCVSAGGHSIVRPDGRVLVVPACGSTETRVYDPTTNAFSAGPATTGSAARGAHSIPRPDGRSLIVHGFSTAGSTLYDPVANTTSAGPAMLQAVDLGGHAIGVPNGTFRLVYGGSLDATGLYDPVSGAMSTATSFPSAATVDNAAFTIQRCDDSFLAFQGNATNDTYAFIGSSVPVSGPSSTGAIASGAHAIERDDGHYLVIHGGGTNSTSIVDAGCASRGVYESEPLSPDGITTWGTVEWVAAPDGVALYVRTAADAAALSSAPYVAITQGGTITDATGNAGVWLQIRIDLTRPVPRAEGASADVWRGRSTTTAYRAFSIPSLESVRVSYR